MAESSVQASQQWQAGLLIILAACVLYATIRGCFHGLLLQLLIPFAIAASILVVYFFADPFLKPLGMNSSTISPGGLLAARGLLGLLCYYLLMLAGGFLFRRTRDYDLLVSRWIAAAGGALLGFFYGLLMVWVLIVLLRVGGRVAEDQISLQAARRVAPAPAVATIAKAKASLDLGWLGAFTRLVDPMPASLYETIDRWSSILSRPDAVRQLLADPVFRPLSDNPAFQALANDPELGSSIQKGDLLAVVTNPKFAQFFADSGVSQVLFGTQSDARYAGKTR
jgi:hypothetical protein